MRYAKTSNAILNPIFKPPEKHSYNHSDKRGLYRLADLTVGVERPSLQYEWRGCAPPSGRSWRFPVEQMKQYDADGRISFMEGRVHLIKQYFGESLGKELQSVWEDIPPLRKNSTCPSAKPPELCSRIIMQSTDPGDWVLDPFCGSGQMLVQAQKLGRHWIGCDNAATSIAAADGLLEKKIGRSSYQIIPAGQESFQDIPRIGTTYTDFYLKIEDVEDTRRKLSRLADLTRTLKKELVDDKRDDEEIIAALQQMIPRLVLLISDAPKGLCVTGLQKRLSGFGSLEENAKDFLVTAKMILDILDDSFDFSVVSVSAWKTVELEIGTKIFGAFRDWVLITYGTPTAFTESDYDVPDGSSKLKQDWEKKVLAGFLRTNKVPPIGQLAAIISKCANSKRTVNESPSFKALIEFIGGQFQNPDYLLGKDGLCSMLTQKQIDLYRNGAAHTSKFDKARATSSFEFVIKVLATFEAGLKPVAITH